MTDEQPELLSALIDREPVDPDALAAALDDPTKRALLVDFIRLRHLILDDDDAGEEPLVNHEQPPVRARRSVGLRVALAAGILVALISGTFWINWKPDTTLPPEPTRVLAFRPGVDWQ
jgi:hypothetical protein